MQQDENLHPKQQPLQHTVDIKDAFFRVDKDGTDVDYDYVDVRKEMQQDENLHPEQQPLQHTVDIKDDFVLVDKDGTDVGSDCVDVRKGMQQDGNLHPTQEIQLLQKDLQPIRPTGTSDQLNEFTTSSASSNRRLCPWSSLKESLFYSQQTINWDSF
ncbi:hypothetical protein ElyMa_002315100, partial [Elysia marginata]